MHYPVGIRSIGVSFPSVVRTNDYYIENYPELFAQAEQKSLARTFSASQSSEFSTEFDREMARYLSDPFRGAVERRVLSPSESPLTLEYRAACDALEAARLGSNDVDLMIVSSLLPENYIAPGNAAYLVNFMGLNSPAWNIESACSSALVALQTACALVQCGDYNNILVVVSSTYSRVVTENDTLSWFVGDAAGAFVVSSLKYNQGILGTKVVDTAQTCGAFIHEIKHDARGNPRVYMRAGKEGGKKIRDTGVRYIITCCEGAAAAAGVTFEEIDFFAFNTPLAWYSSLCANTLGISEERTLNLYPLYGNIGPALPIVNLYHAAKEGKIREDSLVLVYTIGSASTAGATVMRWGDVTLGPAPAPSRTLEKLEKTPVGVK